MNRLVRIYNRGRPGIAIYRYGELLWSFGYHYTAGIVHIDLLAVANLEHMSRIPCSSTMSIDIPVSAFASDGIVSDVVLRSVEKILAIGKLDRISDDILASIDTGRKGNTLLIPDVITSVPIRMVDDVKMIVCAHPHIHIVLANVIGCLMDIIASMSYSNNFVDSLEILKIIDRVSISRVDGYISSLDDWKFIDRSNASYSDGFVASLEILKILDKSYMSYADGHIYSLDIPEILSKGIPSYADKMISAIRTLYDNDKAIMSNSNAFIHALELAGYNGTTGFMTTTDKDIFGMVLIPLLAKSALSLVNDSVYGTAIIHVDALAKTSTSDNDISSNAVIDISALTNTGYANSSINGVTDTCQPDKAAVTKVDKYAHARAIMELTAKAYVSSSGGWIYPVQKETDLTIYQAYATTQTDTELEVT